MLSVTNSASASTTGMVIKNTATTETARLQLDANTATGFAQLEVAPRQLHPESAGPEDLAAEPTDWPGAANSGDERHRDHRLWPERPSDEKVKQNIRDADLDELQAIFDRPRPNATIGPTSTGRPAGLSGPGPAARRRYRKDDGAARRASDPGLRQADGRAVGRLQEAAGKGRSFGEIQEA